MRHTKWPFALGAFVVLSALWVAGAAGQAVATAPASSPTTAAISLADHAYALLSEGTDQALAGRFEAALATLTEAKALAGEEPKIVQAHRLLEEYVSQYARAEAERASEYAATVERVGWAGMTEQYFRDQPDSSLEAKLREKVRQVLSAIGRSGNGDTLDDAAKNTYEELKDRSVQALDESLAALRQGEVLVGQDNRDYARVFRRVVKSLRERLEAYKQVWAQADVGQVDARRRAARELRSLEDGLSDDLADLDGLVTDKPWREALAGALVAQRVAAPADRLTEQPWYHELIQRSEAHGKQFVDEGRWQDALTLYMALNDLDEGNRTYKDMVKSVRRHARVLRLYGNERLDTSGATSQPEDSETTWRELVEGVDAAMAEKAISQLDSYYVTAVDYAQLARGALAAVKVLAETPEAAQTFPGLADASKRRAFLVAVDDQFRAIETRDRPDHLDLTLALNSVLRTSERTVNIPVSVLVVEFTDGFLDELDEFSSMIWPYDMADFEKHTMGHFYGVGVQIAKEPGEPLKVITPLADSPAFKAGIKPGDLILAVDGRATQDMGIDKLIRMITGEKGTKVTLRVKRAGHLDSFDVTLTRQAINIATVRGWQSRPDGQWDYLIDPEAKIAYVRVMQFTDETVESLDSVLDRIAKAGVHSLVLDLRYNPGGLLRSATDVADEFLSRGRLVSTEGRQARRQSVNATPGGKYLDGQLVLLVNQISASAAEIVSGAVQDWDRGLIVGQRTYGKETVQNVIPIRRDRAVLKLTTAYYYLPSGRTLHGGDGKDSGVAPDVEIRMTPKQTKRWLEVRQKTDLLQDVDPTQLRSDLARQYEADLQLATAVLLLKLEQLRERPEPVAAPATAVLETVQH
ncbi:MAG: S41 family peptidase [Phycisphaerae bacterium]|nr:S41 family peptidase [Phycisphaerae bacterium]